MVSSGGSFCLEESMQYGNQTSQCTRPFLAPLQGAGMCFQRPGGSASLHHRLPSLVPPGLFSGESLDFGRLGLIFVISTCTILEIIKLGKHEAS
jgi:hypothetical protein